MKIEYKSRELERVCLDACQAGKKYGVQMAEKIQQRIDEITAADSVEMLLQYRIGRCHELRGQRKGQYAVDLIQPYRLVFQKKAEQIQVVRILEIVDYH